MPPDPERPRLTPAQALLLAKTVSDVYSEAAARLLALVGRRLSQGIDRPEWAHERLSEVLTLRRQAQRVVGALQSTSSARVLSVLQEAYDGGNLTHGTVSGGLVQGNQRAVLAFAADLNRLLDTIHTRILRTTEDVYRQVIAEAVGPLVTGVIDRRAAAAAALDRFATLGITGFTDSSGRSWSLDSYVEMATRAAVGHTYLQGTLDRFKASGRDLVVVSDSPEECPLCRPYEQKVLSIGGVRRPPEVPEHKWGGSLEAAITAGLHHVNCTHSLGAWVPGLTRLRDHTDNPQGYEDRQRQRELERRVRESKRRVAALQELGDTSRLRQQKTLLARRRADLKAFLDDADRKAWVSQRRTSTVAH